VHGRIGVRCRRNRPHAVLSRRRRPGSTGSRCTPAPVRIDGLRLLVWPRLFRVPWFRRFDGYAAWNTILLREPVERAGADLLCHELCHVWQMQHRPPTMPLSYLRVGYEQNPYEEEARRAVESTSAAVAPPRLTARGVKARGESHDVSVSPFAPFHSLEPR
jgi:hypothetical protein